MIDRSIKKAYENLACAIIAQAVKDYMHALVKLKKDPEDISAGSTKIECERFFNSDLFMGLTELSPEYILQIAREEAEKHDIRRKRFITRNVGNIAK